MKDLRVRSVVLRVVALALLLLLALVGTLTLRTLNRVPDTLLYFIRADDTSFTLESVGRSLSRNGDREAHLRRTFAALREGPSPDEAARGLSTALPEDLELLELDLQGDRLFVDVSAALGRGGGTATMIGRLEQLFYTLTQPNYVSSLSLAVEGEPLSLFGGEGLIVENPWVRSEHPDLPRW